MFYIFEAKSFNVSFKPITMEELSWNAQEAIKPGLVSALFKETLEEQEFKGKFHTIVFALLEGSAGPRRKVEEEGKLGAFYHHFGRFD